MREECKEILASLCQRTSVQTLKEFIHCCADDIAGRKPPQFEVVSSTGWSREEFQNAVFHTKMFLVDAVTGKFDLQQIESILASLDKQIISAITNCVNLRSNELKESFLLKAATTPGTSLVDFDWKLKWVLGSSSLSNLQEPLLSVNLHLASKSVDAHILNINSSKNKQSTVNLELNSTELDSLINSLESVDDSAQR